MARPSHPRPADRQRPWSAVGAALATLAVNALHANPDLLNPGVGRVALSLLAPTAAFAAFHLVFESLTQHRTTARNAPDARETGRADRASRASGAQYEHATTAHAPAARSQHADDHHALASAAQQAAHSAPDPQSSTARTRITRTISTKETRVTELIDEVSDHTVRQILADWLAGGGDIHDPELTARVERVLGKSRRTAQPHLQPPRQAAAAASVDPPDPPRS